MSPTATGAARCAIISTLVREIPVNVKEKPHTDVSNSVRSSLAMQPPIVNAHDGSIRRDHLTHRLKPTTRDQDDLGVLPKNSGPRYTQSSD